jgi:hypothetical protein
MDPEEGKAPVMSEPTGPRGPIDKMTNEELNEEIKRLDALVEKLLAGMAPPKPCPACAKIPERLEEWRKERFVLFCPPDLTPEQSRAVLGHLMRNLSRGRIPPIGPLKDYLEGKTPLPPCGYIGCFWTEEHVH